MELEILIFLGTISCLILGANLASISCLILGGNLASISCLILELIRGLIIGSFGSFLGLLIFLGSF